MNVLKHADSTSPNGQFVGYLNRRSGEILCLDHGQRDITSSRSPWLPLRLIDQIEARYESTTPVICHQCGTWLNDASTGYAIACLHDGYWKRQLWRTRSPRAT